jgi:hypothetical protein
MFDPKIKIRKELFENLKGACQELGCASVDELVDNILDKELQRIERNKKIKLDEAARKKEADEIAEKLQGLGYID